MTQYRILPNSVRPELAADKITPINGDLPMSVALVFSPRATRHQHRAVGLLARRLGLAATPNDSPHAITLSGTTGAMQRAFNTTLKIHHRPDGRFRCRSGPVSVPQSWGSSVTAVLGLDTRPQLHPNFHRRMAGTNPMANTRWGFTAPYLAGIYGFPVHAGQGMSIGIVEFGGGYNAAWMQTYLNQCGIRRRPQVTINGKQHLGQQDNNVEVMLDVELAASLAPRARVVVYFRNNTTAGFYNAIAAAVAAGHDAVSVSWGAPESQWTGASMDAINALAQTAGANGTTIAAASGDSGSSDGTSGLAVDFPSSAPYILGCGGTRLTLAGGVYGSEAVWNSGGGEATGGGYSSHFAVPDYQSGVNPYGNAWRIVPDVAADADPDTGYLVCVNGQKIEVGGTSAAAPLWAGLIARLNGVIGRKMGLVNGALYSHPSALRGIVSGNNGVYEANAEGGYSPTCGIGSPNSTIQGLLT